VIELEKKIQWQIGIFPSIVFNVKFN